tara:strand:+ start:1937 stop:2290 length:354 start_codon:yes stop_codon:yes gene_type:complete
MKSKLLIHPRLYLSIIKRNANSILVEYQNNEFYENGERIIKKSNINLEEKFNNFSKSIEILNSLNNQELNKIKNYIKTQNKVLKYHKKNNNYDAIDTVVGSMKLMESFKRKFEKYEF